MTAVEHEPHEWTPNGMWGPYPVEACQHCNAGLIVATPGAPNPYDVLVRLLEKREATS